MSRSSRHRQQYLVLLGTRVLCSPQSAQEMVAMGLKLRG
jgi:hypothetical protein